MKTKIFLVVLSMLIFCSFSVYADSSKPTVLTDKFLINASNVMPVTIGTIHVLAKYKMSAQEEQYEEKSNYSGFDNPPKESDNNKSIVNELQQLQDAVRSRDQQIREENPNTDPNKKVKIKRKPEKRQDKHLSLWSSYSIGGDLLLSILSPDNEFSFYFSEYGLDRYDLSFYVVINYNNYPVELISLSENLALWKIQKKLETGLFPLKPTQSHVEVGQIVSVTTVKYGRQTTLAGNICSMEENGNKFWINVWSAYSLPNTYIVRNTEGQILGISDGESYDGYPYAIQITQEQIDSLVANSKNFGKLVTGNVIGLIALPLTHDLAERLGVERLGEEYIGKRVMIRRYPPKRLQRLGFDKGDLLYSINGVSVDSLDSIKKELDKLKPGDIVSVAVIVYDKNYTQTRTIQSRVTKRTVFDILLGTI